MVINSGILIQGKHHGLLLLIKDHNEVLAVFIAKMNLEYQQFAYLDKTGKLLAFL